MKWYVYVLTFTVIGVLKVKWEFSSHFFSRVFNIHMVRNFSPDSYSLVGSFFISWFFFTIIEHMVKKIKYSNGQLLAGINFNQINRMRENHFSKIKISHLTTTPWIHTPFWKLHSLKFHFHVINHQLKISVFYEKINKHDELLSRWSWPCCFDEKNSQSHRGKSLRDWLIFNANILRLFH